MPEAVREKTEDHAKLMDGVYRYQRHFYDLTRKYYLLGRDTLLKSLDVRPGERVLEVACGTARNLKRLNRFKPGLELYGLDASSVMLKSAAEKLRQIVPPKTVILKEIYAEKLDYRETFGLNEPFDAIFISYGLSMIPPWKEAVDAALRNVKPGRALYVVDFWDQGGWPRWFRKLLKQWLKMFQASSIVRNLIRVLQAARNRRKS